MKLRKEEEFPQQVCPNYTDVKAMFGAHTAEMQFARKNCHRRFGNHTSGHDEHGWTSFVIFCMSLRVCLFVERNHAGYP